jgi:hypothetical protein
MQLGLLLLDQHVQGAWFSTKSIGYYIGLSRVIVNFKIIILDQFNPSPLPHVQLLLRENILQALMVSVDLAAITHEVMPPCLQSKNYSC